MDDLFDDFVVPPDGPERDAYVVEDVPHANRLVRRLRRMRDHRKRVMADVVAEQMRIDRWRDDLLAGDERDRRWIESQLMGYLAELVRRDPFGPKTLRLLGAVVKASATGGQPVIRDRDAYAGWAATNDYIDRSATVEVPWETLLLAVQALRAAVAEDIGDRAPATVAKIADDLDRLLEAGTVYTVPKYGKDGRLRRRSAGAEDGWVDTVTGEPVPGLGVTDPGFNYRVKLDDEGGE